MVSDHTNEESKDANHMYFVELLEGALEVLRSSACSNSPSEKPSPGDSLHWNDSDEDQEVFVHYYDALSLDDLLEDDDGTAPYLTRTRECPSEVDVVRSDLRVRRGQDEVVFAGFCLLEDPNEFRSFL